MSEPSRVRGSGPLAGYLSGFAIFLSAQGYTNKTVVEHLRRLAHLSRWLELERLGSDAVTAQRLDAFVAARRRSGAKQCWSARSFRLTLAYLGTCGLLRPASPEPATALEDLLENYRHYLVTERALAASTVHGYMDTAVWFTSQCCAGDRQRVATLSAAEVSRFVLGVARVRNPRSVNEVVTRLRSLLRFLYTTGAIEAPLAQATPWMAQGRASSVPRTLEAGQGALLLASCDRANLVGARDFAIVTVLVRLGLRVGEVAALELGDIDWRHGELTIRGKGGWRDLLPLPVDVGEALVGYLKRREPVAGCRQVFLQVRAPRRAMTMTDIRAVVRRACARAGMADTGTHRLRHGAATEMLRRGAPLYEIGQVLRHHDVETTAIYAKVDWAALATVAQPWPGSPA